MAGSEAGVQAGGEAGDVAGSPEAWLPPTVRLHGGVAVTPMAMGGLVVGMRAPAWAHLLAVVAWAA